MNQPHVGYLDFDGKIVRFDSATLEFDAGKISVEAAGPKVALRLYGVPFEGAGSLADLPGMSFGPTDDGIRGDPFAEGGIDLGRMRLSFQSLECKCRSYDVAAKRITVWFCADVEDYDSGRSGSVDCTVRCEVLNDGASSPSTKSLAENRPCPNCGKPLRSDKAKQCFNCGADWH